MSDSPLLRASRELFVSVLAGGAVDVDARAVDRLSAMLEEESVPAGRRIFAAGEPIEHVYFMREGRVGLEREGAAAWTVEGSAAFGAFEAASSGHHARSAVALDDLLLLRMPADGWLALLGDDFDLARSVIAEGMRRVADLELRALAMRPEPRSEVRASVSPSRGPLSFVERVALLGSVPMLRAAGVQVLADLAAMLEERSYERDAIVHARGVSVGGAVIVIEGEIFGVRRDADVAVPFGPGSVVCGASWLGEPQLAWESRATTRSRVLVLDAEHWFDMMEEHASLLHAALGTIAFARDSLLEELAAAHGSITVTS